MNNRNEMKRCPICGKFDRLLALSRADNKTMICDDCGTNQAIDDFIKYYTKNLKEDE